jgi:HAD superfamily hydrolase (TIGR01484 family)
MIKCVVFDIGNTLISKNGYNEVDPVLKSDIKRLRDQGLIIGVASMRTYSLSKKVLKDIEFDFYICLSGSQIYINNKLQYDKPLELKEYSHPCVVYYSEDETYAMDEECLKKARDKGFVVEKVKSSHTNKIYNIAIIDINKSQIESYLQLYHVEYWSEIQVLVLQHITTSKSRAIRFISSYYDISNSEILGFGDGPNDIEFLSTCGTSVAMGHDYKELVDSTTFSTDTEKDLGVSRALRKLGLIEETVIFFIESLDEVGGMEIHGQYFIKYFSPLSNLYVITHKNKENSLVFANNNWINETIESVSDFINKYDSQNTMIFFNSGHWIGEMQEIKNSIIKSTIFYRTGGNDIVSAPPFNENSDAAYRRRFWKDTINKCVDYLITNSQLTEKRLIDFGINQAIFRRVVGGVDSKKIIRYKKDYTKTREELLFDNKKINLVTVSRFEPYKRVDLLLNTMSHLESELYHLYLIGDGPLFEKIFLKYNRLSNVTFLGKLNHDKALRYICSADFYIQFSGDTLTDLYGLKYIHTEGMGRTLLEAITSRTPVIVTKCGAFPEILSSKNGVIIDSCNPKKLADKIIGLKAFDSYEDIKDFFNNYIRIWKNNG